MRVLKKSLSQPRHPKEREKSNVLLWTCFTKIISKQKLPVSMYNNLTNFKEFATR